MKDRKNYTSAARAAMLYRNDIVEWVTAHPDEACAKLMQQFMKAITFERRPHVNAHESATRSCAMVVAQLHRATIRYWTSDIRAIARNGSEAFFGQKIAQEWIVQEPTLEFTEPLMTPQGPLVNGQESTDKESVAIATLISPMLMGRDVLPDIIPDIVPSVGRFLVVRTKDSYYLTIHTALKADHIVPDGDYYVADACAEEAFLQQRLGVPEQEYMHEKVLKRLHQGKAPTSAVHVPDIHRIVLRRSAMPETPQEAGAGQGGSFEYSCRFPVRWHWRKQWHPSIKEHKPKFIKSYFKGPESAPLKVPKQTIVEARR